MSENCVTSEKWVKYFENIKKDYLILDVWINVVQKLQMSPNMVPVHH